MVSLDRRTLDRRKGIQSIEIGFRVVAALERAGAPQSLSQIARDCGMTPSKVHFYLVSLTRVGLVAQSATGGLYRLGPAAMRLGLAALAQLDILELAREEMARLSAVTGNTVFLSIWSGNGPTVINRFDGEKVAPLAIRVGAVMSLLGSATGQAFLAWQPESITRTLLAHELADARHADVTATIDRVRGSGLSVIHGMVVPGIFAVAAPIFDHEGGLHCVLTAIDEAAGDHDTPTEVAYALNESARAVSRAAGYVTKKDEATEPI